MAVIEEQATYVRPRRNLKLWGAIGLSLGIVGPTLAMAGNGQVTVASVGKSVPLVFLFGAVGIGIIAHGFIRLTQRYNHAGSAYALVGVTVGPRAGFFSGFAIIGTYTMFCSCCVAAVNSFLNAFIAAAQNEPAHPFRVPWIWTILVCVALSAFLNTRDLRLVTRMLLAIEGIGVLCMTILSIVIFAKGGAKATGIDGGVFSLSHVSFSTVVAAVVAAFLSWAGFEGCAALGEETDDPTRNIPRALTGSIVFTGILFVIVMFAQTVGFGTNAAGQKAFTSSGDSLSVLSHNYIGLWFSLVISFAAVMSAFACHLASSATAGRLLFAYSRDGFGPKPFGRLTGPHQAPINAIYTVLAFALVANVISWASGRPVLGTGDPSLDSYFYFATIGAIMLMIAYLMVEVGAVMHLYKVRIAEVIVPLVGIAIIVLVFYYNLKGQHTIKAPPYIAFMWAGLGLVIAWAAPGLAQQVGRKLAQELDEPAGKDLPMELGEGLASGSGS
ncbi:MAG TPA: APC family permease [Mycobacteriales bacterium]|nr:APC family permease [Mycobacteriales bacterium]